MKNEIDTVKLKKTDKSTEEMSPKCEDNSKFVFDCQGKPISLFSDEVIEAQAVIKKGKFPEYYLKPKFADDPEPVVQHFEPDKMPVVIRSKEVQKLMNSINNDDLIKVDEPVQHDSQLTQHEKVAAEEVEKS